MIKKIILVLFAIFLLPVPVLAVASDSNSADQNQSIEAQISAKPEETAKKIIKQIDPAGKDQKILPDSRFYFLKIWWETIVGWFKFGSKKPVYTLNLSQERLVEVFALYEKNKDANLQKPLNGYFLLSKKIENKDLSANLDTFKLNINILEAFLSLESKNHQNSDVLNTAVVEGINIYAANVQIKDFSPQTEVKEIEGTIVYSVSFSEPKAGSDYVAQINLILNWQAQKKNVLLLPSDKLEILNTDGTKLNNLNDVAVGSKLKVQILNNTIYNYKSAQEIMNPDGAIKLNAKAQATKINVE